MSGKNVLLGVFVVLLFLVTTVSVYAAFKAVAKTDVYVKTGKWSYVIEDARHQGQCRRVEMLYTAREVSVKFYGCNVVPVTIRIKADSTVPICLAPEGPASGPEPVFLQPGDVVEETYVFYENGTLKFAVKISDC